MLAGRAGQLQPQGTRSNSSGRATPLAANRLTSASNRTPGHPPGSSRPSSSGRASISAPAPVALPAQLLNRLAALEAKQATLQAENNALQQKINDLQSQLAENSSPSPFAPTQNQEIALAERQVNPAAGPSAPRPRKIKKKNTEILTNFKRLVRARMGISSRADIWLVTYPDNNSAWPLHPADYEPGHGEAVVAFGPDGEDNRRVQLVKQTRFNFEYPFTHLINQRQVRPILRHMLSDRAAYGVPADMTIERLNTLAAIPFKWWRRRYKNNGSDVGRVKQKLHNERAFISTRKNRKATSRAEALGMKKWIFLSDGTKLARITNDNTHRVYADIEFGVDPFAQSPDEVEWIRYDDETGRKVRRRSALAWRSKGLVEKLEEGDVKRATRPQVELVSPTSYFELPPNFALPSSVRRWMVSRSFQMAHPEACLNVSDNAGPFSGAFKVASGPKEWGEDYVLPGVSGNSESAGEDEEVE
ncbi:hypothetical protein OC834_007719 [Tilletia horrida]|uniref:Uncharacterized protein n=1 Tax=Tilletia horrida TaxID=155126 RepID=A0AAN6GB07_9BASI|nr:hypothetical protein OC834_007719 [Tilletia horrida]KAK0520294.1 hypothetical protein OC835_007256 [Tilletia horrida]KAK0528710.1 hypothetical protein OC842_004463 [Tilletia horrida]